MSKTALTPRILGMSVAFVLSFSAVQAARAESFSARGNEPGWHLEMTEKAITFRTQEGETLSVEPVPAAQETEAGRTYSAVAGGKPFTLTIADRICSDTMADMPFPKTVSLVVGERTLSGCGGDPASLLHGDWKIDAIGGKPVVEKSEPTLAFAPDGSIHGNGSCNRFFGGFTLSGEGLKLSQVGASMMLCDQPVMEQEHALLATFEGITHFEIVSPTQIRLMGASGVLVSLRK